MPIPRRPAVPTKLDALRRTIVDAFMRDDIDTFVKATLEAEAILRSILPVRSRAPLRRRWCPIDDAGWRIPGEHTRARLIYDGLKQGLTPREIRLKHGLLANQVYNAVQFIRRKR